MARATRITANQIEAAMEFCQGAFISWNGTWPSNRGTSASIEKACVDIGITSPQLKRQFAKVVRAISGRGVGQRDEDKAMFLRQLLDITLLAAARI
jgi:hypothetical protein